MLTDLFFNLLVAHIVSDFYLQWNAQCENKARCGFKGYGLWYHAVIVGVTAWGATSWSCDGWWLAAGIMTSHCLIDWAKSCFSGNHEGKKVALCLFVVDQILHIGVLYGLVALWSKFNPSWQQIGWVSQLVAKHPLRIYTAIALLVALKPANFLILHVLEACKVNPAINDDHGNFHSGALIGWLERGLMLVFVVLGQYEAIGFLIAGKSILRFGEASKGDEKSEYVLCGTLLSLSVALILGLCVKFML